MRGQPRFVALQQKRSPSRGPEETLNRTLYTTGCNLIVPLREARLIGRTARHQTEVMRKPWVSGHLESCCHPHVLATSTLSHTSLHSTPARTSPEGRYPLSMRSAFLFHEYSKILHLSLCLLPAFSLLMCGRDFVDGPFAWESQVSL